MKRVNMHDAKTHLSRYIAEMTSGDTLVVCNRNEPVAEIRLITPETRVRRIGVAKGQFTVSDSFFEPLPAEILKAFSGQ